ncbi:unnamed protein product [Linum tenue]|uniref:WRKY domain-containing protein n=1 Tax=Linum tenue TaxID=586396 RepID=A0AAV0KTY0_9ROSI|nr:unnamed protein product [Linum tenue]
MSEENHLYFHHHRYHGAGDDAAAPSFPNYPSPAGGFLADPTPYYNMNNFTDYLHGSSDHYTSLAKAFGLDASPPPPPPPTDHSSNNNSNAAPLSTPNSSVSFSSSEAGGEELDSASHHHKIGKSASAGDQQPAVEDGELEDDSNCPDNKKEKGSSKGKKVQAKGEKRQREPRFAFMTKSEVDHLEDGYRWRKYGQKAVKNSPYPRSYYRCTTQRCGVKKRVERSFEDPSVVITTYEGQHNHPLPSTLRGNAAAAAMFSQYSMLAPSANRATGFPAEFLLQLSSSPSSSSSGHVAAGAGSGVGSLLYPAQSFRQQEYFFEHNHHNQSPQQQQQLQFSGDYGLLQDVVPSMFLKQEP